VRRVIEVDSVEKDSPGIVKLFEYEPGKDCLSLELEMNSHD
jgi:hypothetical protein